MIAVESIRAPAPPIEDSVFKMFRMDGKTVIISGGSGGIGYEVARGLAEAGANVNTSLFFISTTNAALTDPTDRPLVRDIKKGTGASCHIDT
jgi:FlaA1/EpsC-like NDP-sugar epimerase